MLRLLAAAAVCASWALGPPAHAAWSGTDERSALRWSMAPTGPPLRDHLPARFTVSITARTPASVRRRLHGRSVMVSCTGPAAMDAQRAAWDRSQAMTLFTHRPRASYRRCEIVDADGIAVLNVAVGPGGVARIAVDRTLSRS